MRANFLSAAEMRKKPHSLTQKLARLVLVLELHNDLGNSHVAPAAMGSERTFFSRPKGIQG
jgi:hypothetical protein